MNFPPLKMLRISLCLWGSVVGRMKRFLQRLSPASLHLLQPISRNAWAHREPFWPSALSLMTLTKFWISILFRFRVFTKALCLLYERWLREERKRGGSEEGRRKEIRPPFLLPNAAARQHLAKRDQVIQNIHHSFGIIKDKLNMRTATVSSGHIPFAVKQLLFISKSQNMQLFFLFWKASFISPCSVSLFTTQMFSQIWTNYAVPWAGRQRLQCVFCQRMIKCSLTNKELWERLHCGATRDPWWRLEQQEWRLALSCGF